MPLFMDVHSLGDSVTMDDVAKAHQADLATQGAHGVSYLRYWVDEGKGQIFCLVEAPDSGPRTRSTARPTDWWPMPSTRSRRAADMGLRTATRIAAGVVTGVAAAALAMPSAASAHDGGGDSTHGPAKTHGHTSKLAELREATAAFRSGPGGAWTTQVFDLAGITCIEDPHGTGDMGIHFVDVGNLIDGGISRLAPEALIYEPGSGGSLTLVGAEYLVFADAWDETHARPPILYGQRFARVEAGNRYGLPTFYELHVWHERANASGTFNDWNPAVHC